MAFSNTGRCNKVGRWLAGRLAGRSQTDLDDLLKLEPGFGDPLCQVGEEVARCRDLKV